MKAARLHAYHDALKLEGVDEPKADGPFDVIVRIGAAGLCRTDLHIQEGQWAEKSEVTLPYTPGHENAGWVHEIGSGVSNVEVGDTVIVHPFISCGLCLPCRVGDDMHCLNGSFPGIDRDGGFAESDQDVAPVRWSSSTTSLHPRDIAALADAGLTAIHAVKKAIPILHSGHPRGRDRSRRAGAHRDPVPEGDDVGRRSSSSIRLSRHWRSPVRWVPIETDEGRRPTRTSTPCKEMTDGLGAEAIIDFVGEKGAIEDGIAMIRDGGFYYVIGYGENIDIPTIDVISPVRSPSSETWSAPTPTSSELMTLTAQGKVTLHTSTYPLDAINDAMADLDGGRLAGPRHPDPRRRLREIQEG